MADLARARTELAVFAAMIGCGLADFQRAALELLVRVTVIVAPRQSGKSRTLAVLALWWAYRKPGQRVLIVSAGEEGSRRLLAEVRRIAQGSELLRASVVDEFAGLVTLTNGSEIRSVPASERQVRGWSVDLLLVDEAALVSDDLLLGAAFPTTAARSDARIVLASSATVASGAFYDHAVLGESGSEHVRAFRWSLADCEWVTPSAEAALREGMGELRASAELDNQFVGSGDLMFPRRAIDRVTVAYSSDLLAGMHGPARVLGGVDWGATNDRSALVALGRLPTVDGRRVFGIRCAHRWPQGELLHQVVEDIVRSPAHFSKLSAEVNGIGAPCAQMLWRGILDRGYGAGGGTLPGGLIVVEETLYAIDSPGQAMGGRTNVPAARRAGFVTDKRNVHTTAALKAAAYSALRLAVDRGELLIPEDATELIRELLLLRVDLTAAGTERIEASAGHDDLADALMLATQPFKREGGEWQTYLGNLLNPGSVLPHVLPPPELARTEHVEGPDGLLIPRRPAWQSVAGSQLSLPPGLDLTDPSLRALQRRVNAAAVSTTNQEATHG